MYTWIRDQAPARLLSEQLPVVSASFLIAEATYKFHSFTLETLAFLGTWFVLDLVRVGLVRLLKRPLPTDPETGAV